MNKGFVIMAQNTESTDYVKCAKMLKESILKCMPASNVTIITDLPYGDQCKDSEWKLQNDWQVYEASPYEYTIKLEADMIIPCSIDHWWDILKDRDIVVSSVIRDYQGTISNVRAYRQFIDDNQLPDVYNAITYFKKSDNARQFFSIVRNVFENWIEWRDSLRANNNEICTTDWAYAIACHVMGKENTTIDFPGMSMVHMKQYINDLYTENWTKELLVEYTSPIKIATFPQIYPLHYHVKNFSDTIASKK